MTNVWPTESELLHTTAHATSAVDTLIDERRDHWLAKFEGNAAMTTTIEHNLVHRPHTESDCTALLLYAGGRGKPVADIIDRIVLFGEDCRHF